MATQKKPESQMTQMEKAKLAAARVKARQGMMKEQGKKPESKKPEPKQEPKSPNAAALKPMKRPSYLDSMSPEEQIQEMKRMQKADKAYEESRMIKPEGYKKGGMVSTTSRGQGKVMRTRKTRMC